MKIAGPMIDFRRSAVARRRILGWILYAAKK
jgi:hypothetical protein